MENEKKMDMPPCASRGAQNTSGGALRALVDWVSVTLKNVHDVHDVIDLLGLPRENFCEFPTGKYGYKSHMRFGHIAIYYDGRSDMGIHIEMSGQGCREFEQYTKRDWSQFFALLLNLDVNFTRLDLAIDDFRGYFTIQQVINKVRRGHVASRFKEARRSDSYKIATGENTGMTVYFGDASSRLQVRFYDKYKERVSKGHEILEGVTCWNRIECQLRKERAMAAAVMIANESYNVGQMVMGILANYIRFLVPSKDANKSRWKTCDWWEEFLHGVEKLKLTQVAPDATIERAKSWVERQVAPTLAMLYEAFDYDEDLIWDFIREGLPRLTDKHKDMIRRFKEEQGRIEEDREERRQKIKDNLLTPKKVDVKKLPRLKTMSKDEVLEDIKLRLYEYFSKQDEDSKF
jgi:phage replication initiation protein